MAGLDAHPEATGVVGRTDEFVDPAVTDPTAIGLRAPATGVLGHFLGAMLLRREIVDAVRFDADHALASTPDWLARARAHGLRLQPVDGVTLHRRLRPGSLTSTGPAYRGALLAALRANLARSRAS